MRNLVFVLGVGLVAGCASGPEIPPGEVANRRVEQGLIQAQQSVGNISLVRTKARLNPAPCDCPDYEVFLYHGWLRVYLTGSSSLLAGLERSVEEAPLSTPAVSGRLLDSSRLTRNNVKFSVFELEEPGN